MEKKTVGWLTPHGAQTGGNWVTNTVQEELNHKYEFINPDFNTERGGDLFKLFKEAVSFSTYDRNDVDLWIENPFTFSVKAPNTRQNSIVVCHHIHYPHPMNSGVHPIEIGRQIKNELFLRRASSAEQTIVVSDYWERFLKNQGVNNIKKIYNGLDISQFQFDSGEIQEVSERVNPEGKPLIHLGMPANLKGTKKAYQTLKCINGKLITTGRKDYNLPVEHFNLGYEEYLRLLAACDVVLAMSQFDEGWGLFVHEAMLAGTPVVGSGRGGMEQLLTGGNQIICQDFSNLEGCVKKALAQREELGQQAQEYAKQYTANRMVKQWDKTLQRQL